MTRSAQVDTKGLSYKVVLSRAADGDVECQYQAGLMHHYGEGVAKNKKKAFDFCLKAAEQDHAPAQAFVAYNYHHGRLAVRRNYRKAFHWYTLSAKGGYMKAQYSVANMHLNARGTHKNLRRAAYWYLKSAEQGCELSCFQLSQAYRLGKGVPKDIKKSTAFLKQAADRGVAVAQYLYGLEHIIGRNIQADMDEGLRWLEMAADQSHKGAIKSLAELTGFQPLDSRLAKICGFPGDCMFPLRLKTLIRMEQEKTALYGEMADDLRDFVAANPKAGFHFIDDVAKLAYLAAQEAHDNEEEVNACHYETIVRNLTS